MEAEEDAAIPRVEMMENVGAIIDGETAETPSRCAGTEPYPASAAFATPFLAIARLTRTAAAVTLISTRATGSTHAWRTRTMHVRAKSEDTARR